MSQQGLDFGRHWMLDGEYTKAFRATEAVVDAVTLIVAAGACGMDTSDLGKTFVPNSPRHLRLRTAMGVGAIAGKDGRRAIVTPIAHLFGFDVVEQQPLTDKERADRLERLVRSMPLGEQLLDNALGGRR